MISGWPRGNASNPGGSSGYQGSCSHDARVRSDGTPSTGGRSSRICFEIRSHGVPRESRKGYCRRPAFLKRPKSPNSCWMGFLGQKTNISNVNVRASKQHRARLKSFACRRKMNKEIAAQLGITLRTDTPRQNHAEAVFIPWLT